MVLADITTLWSGTSLILFIILYGLWTSIKNLPDGLLLGVFLIWIFGLRWLHKTFKENG